MFPMTGIVFGKNAVTAAHFSDGTSVELWAETNALCGGLNLPGIFVFDEKNVK